MKLISKLRLSTIMINFAYFNIIGLFLIAIAFFFMFLTLATSPKISAQSKRDCQTKSEVEVIENGKKIKKTINLNDEKCLDTGASGGHQCGGHPNQPVKTMINIGCRGKGNPIIDLTFAVIRFLSIGVGIAVVGSLMFAGIQYTTSVGDPNSTAKAIERIKGTVIALLIYIFAFAIINWLVPRGLLQ